MNNEQEPTHSILAKLTGWLCTAIGILGALYSLWFLVVSDRKTGFDFTELSSDQTLILAGWLMSAIAGVIFALGGVSIARARWWNALGRFAVAAVSGFAAFTLLASV